MSVFRDLEIICRACGLAKRHPVAESINAVGRRDLRQQILDDTFQRITCHQCGTRVVVDGPMLYVDFERHHWIELFPAPWERAWHLLETESIERFRRTVVEYAPPIIQDQADEFVMRTVFGVEALREKLIAFDAGLDDSALEALKLGLLAARPEVTVNPRARIRLRRVDEASLHLAIHDGQQLLGELTASRAQLEEASGDDWQGTRDTISGAYVDVGRVLVNGSAPRPR